MSPTETDALLRASELCTKQGDYSAPEASVSASSICCAGAEPIDPAMIVNNGLSRSLQDGPDSQPYYPRVSYCFSNSLIGASGIPRPAAAYGTPEANLRAASAEPWRTCQPTAGLPRLRLERGSLGGGIHGPLPTRHPQQYHRPFGRAARADSLGRQWNGRRVAQLHGGRCNRASARPTRCLVSKHPRTELHALGRPCAMLRQ